MDEGLFMTIGTLSVSTALKTMSLPSPATTVSLHWRMRPHKPLPLYARTLTGLIECKRCSGDHSSWEYKSGLAMSNLKVSLPPFFLLLRSFCFLVSVWLFGTLTWQGEIYCSHSPCFSQACSHWFQIVMDLLKNLARRLHAYRDSRLLDRAVSAEVGFPTSKCNT